MPCTAIPATVGFLSGSLGCRDTAHEVNHAVYLTAGTQSLDFSNMTTQQYQDTYILVPRASVPAATSESETHKKIESKTAQSSSNTTSIVAAPINSSSMNAASLSLKLNSFLGNDMAETFLTTTGSMAVLTSGITSATHSICPWQCAEWSAFARVFQDYEVLKSTITWDNHQIICGLYTNATGTSTAGMFNYGASWGTAGSTDLASTVTTWNQFVDFGDFKMWNWGPDRATCIRTWTPKGCLVYNGATGFYTQSRGYQPTAYGENHTWGRHHFMSSNLMTGSSTIIMRWVVRYKVRFRGRKDA